MEGAGRGQSQGNRAGAEGDVEFRAVKTPPSIPEERSCRGVGVRGSFNGARGLGPACGGPWKTRYRNSK